MQRDVILDITAQGAWNGGARVDNTIYENRGMQFKGGIPVTRETIEERIGVRTRVVAPEGERIGVAALQDLLATSAIDPARIRVLIAATNLGEDKHDPGPASRALHDLVRSACPQAMVFDLYAGCPGFNVAVEALWHLSLAGELKPGDVAVVVGAENPHRGQAFKPLDTAHIIFGDDALATALEPGDLCGTAAPGRVVATAELEADRSDLPAAVARALLPWARAGRWDGLLVDNQLGRAECRIPATAARIQHALIERLFPKEAAAGAFQNFRAACELYAGAGAGFAFDIMTASADPAVLQRLACAYTAGGPYRRLAAVFLPREGPVRLSLVEAASDSAVPRPAHGVLGALTRTHGCFAGYIEAKQDAEGLFGRLDGKGVFLYATRGARGHLEELLAACAVRLEEIELLIEHQANFAMLPLTLEQVCGDRAAAARFLAEKMVTNIHERGNCSVVCMQRLPYDLARGALRPDEIQGFAVNRNLERLKQAGLALYDSVGAGMTRSSFLLRK